MARDWTKHTKSLLLLAVFVVLALGSTNTGGGGGSGSSPVTDRRIDAFVMSHQYVEAQLKAPSTAKFPWYDESFVADLGNDTYRVTAYVDAQNGFGAMIRSYYVCELQYAGNDSWKATKCVILER